MHVIPAHFDTVLVRQDGSHKGTSLLIKLGPLTWTDHETGVRVAQVQVVFQIPARAINEVAPSLNVSPHTSPHTSHHLAYVEWFSPLAVAPDPKHGMYKVRRLFQNGRRSTTIIRADTIVGSVHLFPQFGATFPQQWNSFMVLELCNRFYLNPFTDVDNYLRFM